MKAFVIILIVFVADSFATVVSINEEGKATLKKFKQECITETGVTDVAVQKALDSSVDEKDAKLACFAACFLKKLGFLQANGTFDEKVFRSKIPADVPKEAVDTLINKCAKLAGANVCETGAKLMNCYLQNKPVINK